MFPIRDRVIIATTGLVTLICLKALLKAFRISIGLKSRGVFTRSGVACTRITLCFVGFVFVGFEGFVVFLGPRVCS